jgi:hypothetical protein
MKGERRPQRLLLRSDQFPTNGSQKTIQSFGKRIISAAVAAGMCRISVAKNKRRRVGTELMIPVPNPPKA